MYYRVYTFVQAGRSLTPWMRSGRVASRPRLSQFVCRSCQHEFSTSSMLRKIAQATKSATKNGVAKENKYPSRLMIYDAGDTRTAFVCFWKAMALLQFGSTVVFLAPLLYNNENQPDPNIRLLQTVIVVVAGAVPTAAMSYLTAPFVRNVFIQIPEKARHSRDALMAWTRNIPDSTKLELTTLRIFPFRRLTSVFVDELRALSPQKGRFANIELPKTEAWRRRQQEKGFFTRFQEILKEPRFKFYVKEGRTYTIKSGAPGVWEAVAEKIQRQTAAELKSKAAKSGKPSGPISPIKLVAERERPRIIKRQTARPLLRK